VGKIKLTGPGRGERSSGPPPRTLLFNFDIDGAALKHVHHDFLRMYVEPVLKRGGSVTIVGLASRTGKRRHNHLLSEQRARATLAYLRQRVRNDFHVNQLVWYGERKAELEGYDDETEDPRFRSVILFTSDNPNPPAAPDPRDPSLARSPGRDVGDDIQTGIDIFGMLSSFAEYLPVIGEIAGTLGFFMSIVGAVAQMPLLWWSVRHQNRSNGRIEGLWDAIQDMADQYSDEALDEEGAVWPVLREPRPRQIPEPMTLDQREWMEGRKEGCKFAYELFRYSEGKGGKDGKAEGGRKALRRLYKEYGSGLKDAIKIEFNKKIGKTWPIYK